MVILRSLLYHLVFYATMGAAGVILAPAALASRRMTVLLVRTWCRTMLFLLRGICGTKTQIRGRAPSGNCIVASKHQSFLDVILLAATLDSPRFVMKQELRLAPIFGWYAQRLGCIAIDRSRGRDALDRILLGMETQGEELGQLVIYPQGTRVAPGSRKPYRAGAAIAASHGGLPCIPTATNAGVFWERNSFLRHPGTAVLEFLEPLAAGMSTEEAVAELEARIEPACNLLEKKFGRPGN